MKRLFNRLQRVVSNDWVMDVDSLASVYLLRNKPRTAVLIRCGQIRSRPRSVSMLDIFTAAPAAATSRSSVCVCGGGGARARVRRVRDGHRFVVDNRRR